MNRLVAVVSGFLILGPSDAQAIPFHTARTGLVIPIASGCGIGVHRGPYSGCEPIYDPYYRGNYHSDHHSFRRGYVHRSRDHFYGYHRSLLVNQGACSGRDMYRVCDGYGVCWGACY